LVGAGDHRAQSPLIDLGHHTGDHDPQLPPIQIDLHRKSEYGFHDITLLPSRSDVWPLLDLWPPYDVSLRIDEA
jgi:hypothetical protein